MKLLKNCKVKSFFLLGLICFSPYMYGGEQDVSQFICTDEEVETYMSDEGLIDRHSIGKTTFKEFNNAYLDARLREAKKNGYDKDECLAVFSGKFMQDLDEMQQAFNDAMETLNSLFSGSTVTWQMMEELGKKIKKEINKGICEGFDYGLELGDNFKDELKDGFKDKLVDKGLHVFTEENLFDDWMTDKLQEKFKDEQGLLKWRNGGIDTEHFKEKAHGNVMDKRDDKWEDELDNLF